MLDVIGPVVVRASGRWVWGKLKIYIMFQIFCSSLLQPPIALTANLPLAALGTPIHTATMHAPPPPEGWTGSEGAACREEEERIVSS
jgi:hypothetical protein